MNKNVKSLNTLTVAAALLASMTRDELNSTAKTLQVPVGKSRANTESNLVKAIENNRAGLKAICYICHPRSEGQSFSRPVFIKKLRTYKADKVIQSPAPQS